MKVYYPEHIEPILNIVNHVEVPFCRRLSLIVSYDFRWGAPILKWLSTEAALNECMLKPATEWKVKMSASKSNAFTNQIKNALTDI